MQEKNLFKSRSFPIINIDKISTCDPTLGPVTEPTETTPNVATEPTEATPTKCKKPKLKL